jgi:hypothetical protein
MDSTLTVSHSEWHVTRNRCRQLICCASLLALLAILSIGCVRSVQPILKDDQVTTDDSLTGRWVDSKGQDSVEVTRSPTDSTYDILYTDKDGKKGLLIGRIGKIGDTLIAEFHPADPAPNATGVYTAHLLPLYSFLIVRQTTPHLVFTTLSPDWMKKYVDDHPNEIATFKPDKDSIVISAGTDELQKFILAHQSDAGALADDAIFVRTGDSTTKPANGGQ